MYFMPFHSEKLIDINKAKPKDFSGLVVDDTMFFCVHPAFTVFFPWHDEILHRTNTYLSKSMEGFEEKFGEKKEYEKGFEAQDYGVYRLQKIEDSFLHTLSRKKIVTVLALPDARKKEHIEPYKDYLEGIGSFPYVVTYGDGGDIRPKYKEALTKFVTQLNIKKIFIFGGWIDYCLADVCSDLRELFPNIEIKFLPFAVMALPRNVELGSKGKIKDLYKSIRIDKCLEHPDNCNGCEWAELSEIKNILNVKR